MDGQNAQLGWNDGQWGKVYQAVTDEVSRVNVAGAFLPCCGPLSRSAEVVRREAVKEGNPDFISVDNIETIKLWTLAVHVQLKNEQLADENLSGALLAFRRAANLLARTEDAIVFRGLPRKDPTRDQLNAIGVPVQCRVTSGEKAKGLARAGGLPDGLSYDDDPPNTPPVQPHPNAIPPGSYGRALVRRIAEAIAALESQGHLGPFACVLGNDAFVQAHTPDANSLVLPRDRMAPLLEGPILRSGTMRPGEVVVVSLAGDPIDLVVATAPTVQFLNVTDEARYMFRVYERFTLRIKEQNAVTAFWLGNLTPDT
ncbi:MAG: family 1 encapsulin nanocompartment shell protein [Thermosynechococcaceae cyanobacterium]